MTETTSSPTKAPEGVAHRGARPDQAVRQLHRRRPPLLHRRAGPDHRLPRPERRRQDDHAAHAARPDPAQRRLGDHRRPATTTTSRSRSPSSARRWRRPTSTPAAPAATTCACSPTRLGICADPRRRDARARRHPRGREEAGRRLLDGHAPAARPRRRDARRPAGADPRRTGQRPRPRRHPVAAGLPAPPVAPRARRSWSRATCSRRSSRRSTTS